MAFGVPLELIGVDLAELQPNDAEQDAPRTLVSRVDRAVIDDAWRGAHPERTRELRTADGSLSRTVDFDPVRGYLLRSYAHGRFLISSDGLEVLCAPLARARSNWTAMLVAQVLPLVATLRGYEVFHASAVVIAGRALLFTAPSGTGKTSLALRLALRGAGLLADDVVAVRADERRLLAFPGVGLVRLAPRERRKLTPSERNQLGTGSRQMGKTSYEMKLETEAAPLGAFFVMRRIAGTPPLAFRSLRPVDPFTLLGSTFNLSVRTRERLERQLDLCVRLAREVPIVGVDIGPELTADALAVAVADWAQSA